MEQKPAPFDDAKPSEEEMEARWRDAMEAVTEAPRSPEILLHAASLAEQMGRKLEAYSYYHKAITLDPTKAFLIPKLRQFAGTPEQREEVTRLSKRPTTFARALDDVFVYPFRGGGIGVLALGAIFVYGCRLLFEFNVFLPLVSVGLGAVITAYLSMFYVDVCTSTATGSEDLPEWPDPVRFREFFLDWSKLASASIMSFLPIVATVVALGIYILTHLPPVPAQPPAAYDSYFIDAKGVIKPMPNAKPAPPPVSPPARDYFDAIPAKVKGAMALLLVGGGAVFVLGLVYLPMATLANCVYGHPFACLNPAFIVRSILAAPKNYAICVLAYFGTATLGALLEKAASFSNLFLYTGVVVTVVELYCFTVQMRVLGIFYRMNQARLRWMSD